jgi:hypothetical protein
MTISIVKWSELEKTQTAWLGFLVGTLAGIAFMYFLG